MFEPWGAPLLDGPGGGVHGWQDWPSLPRMCIILSLLWFSDVASWHETGDSMPWIAWLVLSHVRKGELSLSSGSSLEGDGRGCSEGEDRALAKEHIEELCSDEEESEPCSFLGSTGGGGRELASSANFFRKSKNCIS